MSSDDLSKKQQKYQDRLSRSKKETRKKQALNFVLLVVGLGVIIYAMLLPSLKPITDLEPITDLVAPQANSHPLADGNALGNQDAPVIVEVYSDFKCAACQYFYESVEPLLIQNYIETGDVYYIYHTFGDRIHPPESGRTAQAVFCAEDQGAFWGMHDYLFTNYNYGVSKGFSERVLETIADLIGIDTNEFLTCLTSDFFQDKTNEDAADGIALGVPGTPGVIINGTFLDGFQYTDIQTAVDEILAGENPEE